MLPDCGCGVSVEFVACGNMLGNTVVALNQLNLGLGCFVSIRQLHDSSNNHFKDVAAVRLSIIMCIRITAAGCAVLH